MPRLPCQDGGKQVGAGGVVEEMGAGLVDEGVMEEGGNPVRVILPQVGDLGGVAAAHHQQVAHLALLQVLAGFLRDLVREEVHQPVIQGEQPLLYGKADGGGGQALGEGEHGVGGLRVVGLPMALGKDLAVAQQHKAVHLNAIAVELIQQVQHGLGGHAHTFGRNAGKFHEAASFLKRFLSQERKSSGVFSSKGAYAGTLLKSPVKKV